MQFFPGDGYSFTRFEISDSTGDFFVPGLLDGLVGGLQAIEQGIGKCGALVSWKGQGTL